MTLLENSQDTQSATPHGVMDVPIAPGMADTLHQAVLEGDLPRHEAGKLALKLAEGTPATDGSGHIDSNADRAKTEDGELPISPVSPQTLTAPLDEDSVRIMTAASGEPVGIVTTETLPGQPAKSPDTSSHRADRGAQLVTGGSRQDF